MRTYDDAVVARRLWVQVYPCHVAVEPLAHGAKRVVVEGVHVRGLVAVLFRPAVPALPDRGGSVAYCVTPGGIGLVVEQAVSNVGVPGLRQHRAQVAHPNEPGREVPVLSFYGCY